jgi:hypothetical protein
MRGTAPQDRNHNNTLEIFRKMRCVTEMSSSIQQTKHCPAIISYIRKPCQHDFATFVHEV